ncbi:IS5 family transposase, partial [Xanthomonas arboricola]|uniref:transposase n=1 Tax=Xanthomonas euroxanthea TaxID=2259622 RepID=UPI00179B3C85
GNQPRTLNQAATQGGGTSREQRWEHFKANVRAKVEHPFRVIKRQFGYTKIHYRGLAKNTAQVLTLFALSNLWMKRRQLLPTMGGERL